MIIRNILGLLVILTLSTQNIFAQKGNLVRNGSFESEKNGIYSDYEYSETNTIGPGKYTITDKAPDFNGVFVNPTGSTGLFLLADGYPELKKRIWYDSIIIQPNTTYTFSCLAANIHVDLLNPPVLKLNINGKRVSKFISLSYSNHKWKVISTTFTSENNQKKIEISIDNFSELHLGNDFAIDNIFFGISETATPTSKPVIAVETTKDIIAVDEAIDEAIEMDENPPAIVEPIKEPIKEIPIVIEKKDSIIELPVVVKEEKQVVVIEKKIITPVAVKKPVVVQATKPIVKKPVIVQAAKPVVKKPVVVQATKPVVKKSVIAKATKPVVKKPVVVQAKPVVKKTVVKKDTTNVIVAASASFNKELTKEMVHVGQKVELSHIYFERAQFTLLSTSIPELNDLINFMKKYPTIRIRLEGHTDNGGKPLLNVELSEKRVKEVKKYLVEQGIAEKRIEWMGYGGAKALNDNKDEAHKKLNRRVEVVIIGK